MDSILWNAIRCPSQYVDDIFLEVFWINVSVTIVTIIVFSFCFFFHFVKALRHEFLLTCFREHFQFGAIVTLFYEKV